MRGLAVAMVVVGAVLLVFTLLSVMGYFMVEEDDPASLVVAAVLSGLAIVLLWVGTRLHRRT
jgi:hypothetical protein